MIRSSGPSATIHRPWYILRLGHRWPYALVPLYWAFERLSWTREAPSRLGLVALAQVNQAVVKAIEDPHTGVRIVDVPAIRESPLGS